mgnify:CR=1 FL=1
MKLVWPTNKTIFKKTPHAVHAREEGDKEEKEEPR